MGPEKFTGTWNQSHRLHLLRRTLFGFNEEDILLFQDMSLDEAVDLLLEDVPLPSDPPSYNYRVLKEDPFVEFGETWVEEPAAWFLNELDGPEIEHLRYLSSVIWVIKHFVNPANPPRLHPKMMLFWHNHLATSGLSASAGKYVYKHIQFLWNRTYSDFKTIMLELTKDPLMLLYLNGAQNFKEAPDENYARELQELFCIGKGPDAKFEESDVQEAARVLTGWSVDWDTVTTKGPIHTKYYDFNHETRDKKFSSFYGNKVIRGRSGNAGQEELVDLIDMVVEHQECSLFICRKLYRFFVHHEISDVVEQEFIRPLATLFENENYEIRPVLKAMFTSAHFYEDTLRGAMIKSPSDTLFGFWRAHQLNYPEDMQTLDHEFQTHLMFWHNMADMSYRLFEPPSVSGWPAYYQIPSFDKQWITTFTLISRIIVTDSFLYEGFWTPLGRIPYDYLLFTDSLPNPKDPNDLIDDLLIREIAIEPTEELKKELKAVLLQGQTSDSYWTNAWLQYKDDPNDTEKKSVVRNILQHFYLYIYQLPEYQLQ